MWLQSQPVGLAQPRLGSVRVAGSGVMIATVPHRDAPSLYARETHREVAPGAHSADATGGAHVSVRYYLRDNPKGVGDWMRRAAWASTPPAHALAVPLA